MKKLFTLAFVFLILFKTNAQISDTTRVSLSEIEFEQLKSDFSAISKTKLFHKNYKANENYLNNTPFVCSTNGSEEVYEKCLFERLGRKKAQKVIALKKKASRLFKRLANRFPKTFVLLKKATIQQRAELLGSK